MAFRVGQKVVCVSGAAGDVGYKEAGPYSKPTRGGVYTIATINYWPARTILTLVECDNSHLINKFDRSGLEPGFNAKCFRPIVERKTDISFAHEILRKVSRADRVRA